MVIIMIIAITGSISCGKSSVSSYLKKKYKIIDADKIGHRILEDIEVLEKIKEKFTDSVLVDEKIDRKKLGELVFSSKEKLEELNAITHPIIRKKIIEEISNQKEKFIFLDIALLYEANFVDLVDEVIVVHCDYDTQVERLMKRNNFSKEEAVMRINSQMLSAEKSKRADYVIDNSSTLENTYEQVDEILDILREKLDGFRN